MHALVLGGSGTVGREVVRRFRELDVAVTFTWHAGEERARAVRELGARALQLDLADSAAVARLGALDPLPDLFVCCAGSLEAAPLAELDDDRWQRSLAVNATGPVAAARALGLRFADRGGGAVVFVGGLDRAQSLPVPVAYAAAQGLLAATTMAMAKELAPKNVRVLMVALGLLDAGLGLRLSETVRKQYLAMSALRRFGAAREAARAICALALHDGYLTGKVVPVNGGI